MERKKVVRTEQTTLDQYYKFPAEAILSDLRMIIESGNSLNRSAVVSTIFSLSYSEYINPNQDKGEKEGTYDMLNDIRVLKKEVNGLVEELLSIDNNTRQRMLEDRLALKNERQARGQKEKKEAEQNEIKKKLKIHRGGLYKPSDQPTYLADDLISDTFKKWQKEQNNNPETTA